jgi:hypothetical protein
MTEQYNQPTDFDEIDKLNYQLEAVQKLHAESLRELQENEGKLLDKSAYRAKRQAITEAHEQASKLIQDQIASTMAETRKRLALELRYSGETAQEKENWAEAVRLVEGAGDSVQKIEELCHRAVRWGDCELARALVLIWGGRPGYRGLHEVLAQVDPRVKATYDYECKHGIYKKGASSPTWAGWQTYGKGQLPDIPGRAPDQQPNYLREQRRAKYDQQHGIANKKYN